MITFSNFLERTHCHCVILCTTYTFSGRLIHYNWLCAMSFSRIYVNEKIHQIHQTKKIIILENTSEYYFDLIRVIILCLVYFCQVSAKKDQLGKIIM